MTSYVAQMNAAWHAFVAFARPEHPRLRVVFALLAGGAPFHLERLAARGGPAERAHDPLLFYDTSSYGPRAIDTAARFVGVDQLVHGSDAHWPSRRRGRTTTPSRTPCASATPSGCWELRHDRTPAVPRPHRARAARSRARARLGARALAPARAPRPHAPPLWRMGAYLVEPDGALRRFSVSYAEELRPLDEPLAA